MPRKKKKKEYVTGFHQKGTSVRSEDILYKAKKPGKRLSTRKKSYYEYRANRSDKKPRLRL